MNWFRPESFSRGYCVCLEIFSDIKYDFIIDYFFSDNIMNIVFNDGYERIMVNRKLQGALKISLIYFFAGCVWKSHRIQSLIF